ncbi:MAG: AAA family ATPase, partial [Chitinophagaceae bacterium]
LQNRIQRAAIMADGNRIRINDMELPAAPPGITLREAREALERDLLQRALATHSGKITAAAKELGISRPTFYELMDKLGLEKVE